jgi:dUTP pyrophosphatase
MMNSAIEKGFAGLEAAETGSKACAYWKGFLDGINAQMADILKMMMDNGTAPKPAIDFVTPEIQVPLMLEDCAIMPGYAHDADAGMDLFAAEEKIILAHSRGTVRTGVHMAIPEGYFGAIRAKSGLLKSFGILCSGTVDSGYTGEIMVTLVNTSSENYEVAEGSKVAQMILIPFQHAAFKRVERLEETPRGDHGFGSSGR